jgi:hypothetical protein
MKRILSTLSIMLLAIATIAQVPNYVPTNGLVGYWPFDGNANDESDNAKNADRLMVDITNLANGAYMLRLVHDEGMFTKRLIKN